LVFSSTVRAAAEPAFVDGAGVDPTDLVLLSELAAEGFGHDGGAYVRTPRNAVDALAAQLDGQVVLDDIGRRCVTREVARRLFADRAAAEVRWREAQDHQVADHAERAAANRPWPGIPASFIPEGVAPAAAMLQAAKDAAPRRQSVLQHALSNEGAIEYHPAEQVPE
jgi:hypothetical protein